MTREEAHTLLEVMAIELTGELADIECPVTERTKLLGKQLEAIDMAIEALHREEAEEKGYCHRIRPKADAEPTETSTLGEKHQLSHGRLIDADELKKHLDGAWEELNDDGERKGVRLARWYLISAPTVDSTIDVVRCKDCDNFDYTFNYCNFLDAGVEGEDFFCAYGERREK